MYVDESGDTGLNNSPTEYFALTGLVVHESRWRDLLDAHVSFRRTMKAVHGLPMRTEIHASEYIRSPPVKGMAKHVRLAILRNLIDELAKLNYLSITSVIVDKRGKPAGYDVFDFAWKTLFQRFENTMQHGNLPGSHATDKGMLIVDNTDGQKLQGLVRRMAVINYIPSIIFPGTTRNLPILRIVEDPHNKDSKNSYFIQSCDACAFFLHQMYKPNSYVKRKSAQNYYKKLAPVLNSSASRKNALGIVEL
jgi:hypothetical protein